MASIKAADPEHRAQQILHEFQRGLVVVVNEEPHRTVVAKHVVHETSETQLGTKEQNKNIMAAPARQAKVSAVSSLTCSEPIGRERALEV
ncbi:hypothetical protein QIH80_40705 [Bradyrhizobium elkanii]|nr:hypothetical protein QIH80_40705 [Bradyrhizobium elkanii]